MRHSTSSAVQLITDQRAEADRFILNRPHSSDQSQDSRETSAIVTGKSSVRRPDCRLAESYANERSARDSGDEPTLVPGSRKCWKPGAGEKKGSRHQLSRQPSRCASLGGSTII